MRPQLILELDLTEPLAQGVPTDPVSALLSRRQARLHDVLIGLSNASRDERVEMLVTKVGTSRMGFARAQELRDAVLAFRSSGRPAIAWAESFGEWSPGLVPYYLATAFDEIWLQPSGDVTLGGLALGTPFLRGALDHLEVEPQVGQRYEYKNAADVLLRSAFSDAHREAMQRLATSVVDQVVDGIAGGRRLDPTQVRKLVDQAPVVAEDALAAGGVGPGGVRGGSSAQGAGGGGGAAPFCSAPCA